jgi:hypothetical protein
MTRPPATVYRPDATARPIYDRLYDIYLRCHDHFGRDRPELMADLRELRKRT